jgi:hypothetical protein
MLRRVRPIHEFLHTSHHCAAIWLLGEICSCLRDMSSRVAAHGGQGDCEASPAEAKATRRREQPPASIMTKKMRMGVGRTAQRATPKELCERARPGQEGTTSSRIMGKVHVRGGETRQLQFDFHALGSNRAACLPEAMQSSAGGSSYLQHCNNPTWPGEASPKQSQDCQEIEGVLCPAQSRALAVPTNSRRNGQGLQPRSRKPARTTRPTHAAMSLNPPFLPSGQRHHGGVVISPFWASSPIQCPGLTNGPRIALARGHTPPAGKAALGRSKICRVRHPM